jgi:hypothetical protein
MATLEMDSLLVTTAMLVTLGAWVYTNVVGDPVGRQTLRTPDALASAAQVIDQVHGHCEVERQRSKPR